MLSVIKANYLGNYAIELSFNNHKTGIANLKDTVFNDKRKIFTELQDKDNFVKFKIKHNTLVWENGLDLAPEFLFFTAFKQESTWQDIFKQWGYIAS